MESEVLRGTKGVESEEQVESGAQVASRRHPACSMHRWVPDAMSGILPVQYRPPELIKAASSSAPPTVLHATDAWSLGCLIFQVFNANFTAPQQLAQSGNIPASLLSDYKKLLATNPSNRLNPRSLLDSAFFKNELVASVEFLDNLALQSATDKDAFFTRFALNVASFPPEFCKFKLLPLLTKSLDYGSGLTCFSAILQAVLKIGAKLTPAEFAALVLPSVLKLFSSNERAIRVHLLQHLGDYAGSLTETLVNDNIFAHVLTGFSDSNAILRELTVKSLLHLAPKLNSANMDQALRMLAKLQTDPEPAIRTNTCYCIAKMAPSLSAGVQEKVLFAAFSKCLRDPFPPARVAGLMAFLATLELLKAVDVARKLLPTISPSLADDVREVREAALKLLEACTARISAFHAQLRQQQEAALAANPNAMGSHQQQQSLSPNTASTAAPTDAIGSAGAVLGSLSSWAVSTVRSKISNADTNPPAKTLQAGSSAANANFNSSAATNLSSANSRSPYGNTSSSSSSSVLAAAAGSASPTSAASSSSASGFDNDDFFADFAEDKPGDALSDDDADTIAVSLSTSKKASAKTASSSSSSAAAAARRAALEQKKLDKKSAKPSLLAPPPAATPASSTSSSSSLDSWSFDMDDSSTSNNANSKVVDDFDDWGSSVISSASSSSSSSPAATAAASKPAAAAALKLPMHGKKPSDGGDLLSFSTPSASSTAAAYKKNPSSSAAASDPFASLSLASSSSSSPKLASSSPGGGGGALSLKPRAAMATPMAFPSKPATTTSATAAAAAAAAKKSGGLDDWGDFLNS